MRPLAVLILVLGAAAALLFAVTSLTGSGDRSGGSVTVTPKAVVAAPRTADPVDQIVPPDVPVETPRVVETRSAVETTVDGGMVRGAYANWIEGRVLDPDGAPLASARVDLFQRQVVSQFADVIKVLNNAPEDKPYKRAKTSGDGYFRFATLQPGTNWSLVVSHDEFSRREVGPIDVPAEGGVNEEITLDTGYALQGFVREGQTGAPVMRAVVTLENTALIYGPPGQRGSSDRQEVETDERGYYRFGNITAGQRAVMCSAPGYGTQIKYNVNFAGSSDKTVDQDFQLEPAQIIAGRVLGPDRSGVEGIVIDAIGNSHDPGCRSIATSKADGEFVLEALNEGFYTLRAVAEGWDVDPVLRVEAGTTDVEIQLFEQGGVLGKVVDAETGRAVPDFSITVRKLNNQSKAWGAQIAKAAFKGRDDGSFSMSGISEGSYVVQGDARGYASSFSEEFTVTQGMTTPDIEVRMSRGGTLKGRVIDAQTGAPIARAQIATNDNNYIDSEFTNLLVGLQPSALTRARVTTDNEGRFEIRLLTPETYQIKVTAGDYTQLVMNDVRVGDGLSTDLGMLKLARGATVSGTVYGQDGEPAAGCSVSLSRQDNRMWGNITARTDTNGRFILRNAAPGEYKLAASRPKTGQDNPFMTILDMKNSEVQLSIVEGQTLEQDLYLKAAQ